MEVAQHTHRGRPRHGPPYLRRPDLTTFTGLDALDLTATGSTSPLRLQPWSSG